MSLSKNVEQAGISCNDYAKFEWKPFDAADVGRSLGANDGAIFRSFWNDDKMEERGFQYVPSDGRECAEELVAKAKIEGERIVAEAKKKATVMEQQGYEKGYEQGEKDGREMGAKKLDGILDRINGVLKEILECRKGFPRLYEKRTLDLICRIAEKVVRGRIKADSDVVRGAIMEALELAGDRTEVTVKVNPEDMEYVKELRPEFFDRIKDLRSMSMESDPSVSKGGCVVETGFGHVDASVESQLEKITAAVRQAYESTTAATKMEGVS
jgi:flagellar assembly protein FliH